MPRWPQEIPSRDGKTLVRYLSLPKGGEKPASSCCSTARPITHVDRISKPLLIGQGANDPRVIRAESEQIVEAMKAKKIPVTYVLFPDEGHGCARPETSKAFNAVAEGFLGTCLDGRVQAIGDDFKGSSPTGAQGVAGLAEALKSHGAESGK